MCVGPIRDIDIMRDLHQNLLSGSFPGSAPFLSNLVVLYVIAMSLLSYIQGCRTELSHWNRTTIRWQIASDYGSVIQLLHRNH